MDDRIAEAIQELLNREGDGWTLSNYIVAMQLQRLSPEGEIEGTDWSWAPRSQPTSTNRAMLQEALGDYYSAEVE
ncbi:DUF7213 family protein [Mycolicibacterium canariasense]|nr:hypothetical protein [Mycolicibacterium canariasense]MCV7210531.1 hypothetical protein [Mycolicibacterium canariasense]